MTRRSYVGSSLAPSAPAAARAHLCLGCWTGGAEEPGGDRSAQEIQRSLQRPAGNAADRV